MSTNHHAALDSRGKLLEVLIFRNLDHSKTERVIRHALKKKVTLSVERLPDTLQRKVIVNFHSFSHVECPLIVQTVDNLICENMQLQKCASQPGDSFSHQEIAFIIRGRNDLNYQDVNSQNLRIKLEQL